MKISIKKIEKAIIRQRITSRGGGIEIRLDSFGFKGERMAVYQNYLGGGMLGAICVNDTLRSGNRVKPDSFRHEELDAIGEQLKRYFHNLTNPETGWESVSYDQNQNLPVSGY